MSHPNSRTQTPAMFKCSQNSKWRPLQGLTWNALHFSFQHWAVLRVESFCMAQTSRTILGASNQKTEDQRKNTKIPTRKKSYCDPCVSLAKKIFPWCKHHHLFRIPSRVIFSAVMNHGRPRGALLFSPPLPCPLTRPADWHTQHLHTRA